MSDYNEFKKRQLADIEANHDVSKLTVSDRQAYEVLKRDVDGILAAEAAEIAADAAAIVAKRTAAEAAAKVSEAK